MAYYLDKGVWFFGAHVESAIDSAGEAVAAGIKNAKNREVLANGARIRTLEKLLGGNASAATQFRDPAKTGAVK
jgi:hypothetical protein